MLGHTFPSTLNAMTLRTLKGLGLWSLCPRALWAFSLRGTFLSSQGTFLFLPAFVMQWPPQHPFTQTRNVSLGHREMGSQPRTWGRLGILTHEQRSVPRFSAGLFEAQLGTFSLGGYKVPRKNEPYQPYCFLFSHLPLKSELDSVYILLEQCKPVLLQQLQGVCWLLGYRPGSLPG